jgi:flavodoxin/Pyruvate/2-oxoacid:ferredoxin oxidoreductase delta subunit
MPSALIAKFSQTGSTDKIAEQIAAGLESAGWLVDLHDITPEIVPDLEGYDLLGIGSPTYFYRPPFVVQDFVRALPDLVDMASFVFVLHGTHRGATGNRIRAQLEAKNATDLGYFHSFGADYWLGYLERGYLFSPDSPTEDELSAARTFGETVANRHGSEQTTVEPLDPPTPLIYRIERSIASRTLAKGVYSRAFRADSNCTRCGLCIRKCPVGNITAGPNGEPHWHSECLLCATCELVCPQDAVRSPFDWFISAPFAAYNIRKAIKKPYPHAKVQFARGQARQV